SCTSPLLGGRSTTSTSIGSASVPAWVWVSIWVRAWLASGPRQIMASSALVRSPTDMALSFFFQAEDAIRDFHVTGVQTCALPIYGRAPCRARHACPSAPPRARSARHGSCQHGTSKLRQARRIVGGPLQRQMNAAASQFQRNGGARRRGAFLRDNYLVRCLRHDLTAGRATWRADRKPVGRTHVAL